MQKLTRKLFTREGFLTMFTLSVGGLISAALGIPILGWILAPLVHQPKEKWTPVKFVDHPNHGATVTIDKINLGDTREVSFESNAPTQWAGTTAIQGAWLRRTGSSSFIAYSLYCPHLGCPVHWLGDPKIFLCPCHGSVFNSDGSVAGGPAPRPLFTYNVRIAANNGVEIQTHPITVAT